jgi:hypothetical protein
LNSHFGRRKRQPTTQWPLRSSGKTADLFEHAIAPLGFMGIDEDDMAESSSRAETSTLVRVGPPVNDQKTYRTCRRLHRTRCRGFLHPNHDGNRLTNQAPASRFLAARGLVSRDNGQTGHQITSPGDLPGQMWSKKKARDKLGRTKHQTPKETRKKPEPIYISFDIIRFSFRYLSRHNHDERHTRLGRCHA